MRQARGIDGPVRRIPPRLRERLAALPPAERKALIARIRQIRQEQQSGSAPPAERAAIIERAEQIRQRRAAMRQFLPGGMIRERPRWRDMTDEQRQSWRSQIQRRRPAMMPLPDPPPVEPEK
jgi:predicted Fe-S protein YdhL (DUF1289 family)